jgi:hypothetical protein
MRGGTDERRFRRSSERSEGEDKAMKVVCSKASAEGLWT